MSPARDLAVGREQHSLLLRVALFMLLLLVLCCAVPAERRLVATGVAASAAGSRRPVAFRLHGPSPDAELTLRLNLPAFRLDVFTNDRLTRSYPVAVGASRYRTPRGEFEITRVVWNPWWYPPASDWARKEKVTPPGPNNPMGKVKLQMRGPYYVHGTPWPLTLGHAASHGCIRMLNEDAIALARLVQMTGGAVISAATTDSLAGPLYETREIDLPRPVPFRVTYELAEVRGDTLMVYPDVYGLARGATRAHALAALARAEYDTTAVDHAVLRRLLARAARRPQAMWVDSLIPLPLADPEMTRTP